MRRIALVVLGLLVLGTGPVSATPHHVVIDLTGLGGSDIQLQAALYDNSGVIGDSWVLMDNVVLGAAVDDFEDGTLGSFDDSLNPASVAAVGGSLNGVGSYLMRVDEDPVFSPTLVYRDYLGPGGTMLTFDFEMTASRLVGPFGFDEFVISLLDPQTLDPLVTGLNGFGDVLAFSASGVRYSGEVSVTAIPAPAGLLLGLIGVGGVSIWRRGK